MDRDGVENAQEALLKLAHIATRLEGRCREAVQQLDDSAQSMLHGARRLGDGVDQFNQQVMTTISRGAQAAVAEGTQTTLARLDRELEKYASQAKSAAGALAQQSHALNAAQRTLVWKGLITLAVGSLLIAGGSAWVAHRSMQEIRRAEFSQAILDATRSGALTTCGKEQALCVKVGRKPRRADQHGDYVMVEP